MLSAQTTALRDSKTANANRDGIANSYNRGHITAVTTSTLTRLPTMRGAETQHVAPLANASKQVGERDVRRH
jgi:hypothetical protein